MSTEIDQRIVEMKFDNKNFEKNISTSMSSLEKFKQSLKFDKAGKSLDDFNQSAKKFSLAPMLEAADGVTVKFNAMSVAAISAIDHIVKSAMQAGEKLVKSLSTDQIVAGWNKLEEKSASVQTIMNATGKSVDQVNKYLDKLMWFSDETSYGFTDMTQAIAQMTSSGGDIEKLIPMVMGVANATAYAGKTAQVFSRVMYNLNQSYGAGYLTYMDWRSVELAGVASQQLKQVFIDTAEQLGKINKGVVTLGNFGTTLKERWADTEVMEKAFGKFAEVTEAAYKMTHGGVLIDDKFFEADTATEAYEILGKMTDRFDGLAVAAAKSAQEAKTFGEVIDATKDAVSSKWMKTFELIIGNYQEAKEFFSRLAEEFYVLFAEGGETRNTLLTEALTDGLDQLEKKGIPDLEAFGKIALAVADSEGKLTDELRAMVDETGHLDMDAFKASLKEGWLSADLLDEAVRVMTGDLRHLSDEQLKEKGYTDEQIAQLKDLQAAFMNGGQAAKEWAEKLARMSGRNNLAEAFWNLWDALFAVDEETGKALGVVSIFKETIGEIFPSTTAEGIYQATVKIKEWTEGLMLSEEKAAGLRKIITVLVTPLKWLADLALTGVKGVGKLLGYIGSLAGKFTDMLGTTNGLKNKLDELFGNSRGSKLVKAYGDAVNRVRDALKTLRDRASEAWEKFKMSDSATAGLQKLRDLLSQVGGWIIDRIVDGLEAISKYDFESGIKNLLDGAKDVLEFFAKIPERIETLYKKLSGAKGVNGVIAVLIEYIDKLRDKLGTNIDTAKGSVAGAIEKLKGYAENALPYLERAKTVIGDFIKTLTPGRIVAFAFSATLISMFANFSSMASSLSDLAGKFKAVGDSISGFFKQAKKSAKVSIVAQIALAIGVLAGSLYALAKLPKEDLIRAGQAIAQVVLLLSVSVGVLGALDKFGLGASRIAKSMLQISAAAALLGVSIAIITSALKKWQDLDIGQVLGISIALLPFVLGMAVVVKAMGALSKDALKAAVAIGLLVTDLLLLAGAVKILRKIKIADVLSAIPQYLLLLTGLLGLAKVAKKAGKNAGSFGLGVLAMSAGLILIGQAIKQIGKIPTEDLVKGGIVVAGALALFALIARAFNGDTFTHNGKNYKLESGKNAARVGVSIALMSASMLILGKAIEQIGKISTEDLVKGGIVVAGLMGIMTGIIAVSKTAGKAKSATGTILALSLFLGITVAALMVLSTQTMDELMPGVIALSSVLIAVGAAIALVKGMKLGNAVQTVVVMGFVLGEAVIALLALNQWGGDGQGLIQKATALGEVMLAVSAAVLILSKVGSGSLSNIGTGLIGFTGAIAALVLVSNVLGDLVTEADASAIDNGIAVLEKFCSAKFAAVVAGIAVLTGVMGVIGQLGAGPLIIGIGAFSLAIIALTGVIGILGAMVKAGDSDMSIFDKGVEIFKKIGDALGSFVGNIINGVLSGIGAGVGSAITSLGQGIAGFVDAFGSIDSAATENLKNVAEALLVFGGAGVVTAFSNILNFGSTGKKMGRQLSQFAPYLAEFADAVSGHDFSNVSQAAEGAKGLAEFVKALPKTGGWIQKIVGESSSLNDFAKGIKPFGEAIVAFQEAMPEGGIDPSLVQSATDAGKMLAGLQRAIPKSDGAWQGFFGEHDWGQFTKGVAQFSVAIRVFNNNLASLGDSYNPQSMESAVKIGKGLAEIGEAIPPSGGVWQVFSGEHDWNGFREGIIAFAWGIRGLSMVLGTTDLDIVKITTGIIAGKRLADIAASIPTTGGIWQDLFGGKDLSGFAASLQNFGDGIHNFYAVTMGIDKAKFDGSVELANSLVEIATAFDPEGPIQNLFNGTPLEGFERFGTYLNEFGTRLVEYYTSISTVDWSGVGDSIDAIKQLISMATLLNGLNTDGMFTFTAGLANMAQNGLTAFSSTFTNAEEELVAAGEFMVTKIFLGVRNGSAANTGKSAVTVIDDFCDGFRNAYNDPEKVQKVCVELVEYIQTTIDGQEEVLISVGRFIVDGIIEGINGEWSELNAVIVRKARGIAQQFQDTLTIESPSKVMRDEVGTYIVQGIAEGITKDMSAEDAAKKKAENIVSAFKEELDKIDLDIQTEDLEFELWGKKNSSADKQTKYLKELAHANSKLEKQAKKVMTAEAEYKATLQALGADSASTQEAYNKYLQEQTTLREQASEKANLIAGNLTATVRKDELGRYIVEGIAAGITSDMTAEEAAKAKAQNIASAFQNEMDKLDVNMSLADAEYQAWNALHEGASDTNKLVQDIRLSEAKLATEGEKVMLAYANVLALEQEMAEAKTPEEALAKREAYADAQEKLLDRMTALAEEQNRNNELQKNPNYAAAKKMAETSADTMSDILDVFNRDTNNEFYKSLQEHMDLDNLEVILHDFSEAAETGTDDTTTNVEDILDGLVEYVNVEFAPEFEKAFVAAITNAGEAAGDALLNVLPSDLVDKYLKGELSLEDAAKWAAGAMEDVGNGALNGLKTVGGKLHDAYERYFVKDPQKTTEEGNKIGSPSKVYYDYGQFIVLGFINGIESLFSRVNATGTELSATMTDSMAGIVATIDNVLNSDIDYQPVISPVLDLTDLRASAGQLSSLLNSGSSYSMALKASANTSSASDPTSAALNKFSRDMAKFLSESVNTMQEALDAYAEGLEVHVTLQTQNNKVLAEELVSPLISVSRSRGTPFYTPPM